MRLVLIADMPEDALQAFLGLVRSFESQRPQDVHMSLSVDAPTLSMADALAMLTRVDPPLKHLWIDDQRHAAEGSANDTQP